MFYWNFVLQLVKIFTSNYCFVEFVPLGWRVFFFFAVSLSLRAADFDKNILGFVLIIVVQY